MSTTAPALPREFGTVFEIRHVERELAGLLQIAAEVSGCPLQRVHMSNLVVWCDQLATADDGVLV